MYLINFPFIGDKTAEPMAWMRSFWILLGIPLNTVEVSKCSAKGGHTHECILIAPEELIFRGHDEIENSLNQGSYVDLFTINSF